MSRFDQGIPCCDVYPFIYFGKWTKWVYPPLFQTKVRGGKMQTSSPPVITPNRSQSNPDNMITLPRPIQSVDMDLHDVSGTSTGQTLPRERRAPPGTHFCPTLWWVYPHSATIFILHPLLSTFSSTFFVRNILTFDHSSTLKRRPQTSVTAADLVWVCAPPRTIRKWLRRLAFWILRTRAQDPCSCCLIFRTQVDEKVDKSGWRIKIANSSRMWVYPPNCRTKKSGCPVEPFFPAAESGP